jgi:hypothetical protein
MIRAGIFFIHSFYSKPTNSYIHHCYLTSNIHITCLRNDIVYHSDCLIFTHAEFEYL